MPGLSSEVISDVTQALQNLPTSAGLDDTENWGDILNQLDDVDLGGGDSGGGGAGLGPQSLVAGVDAGSITLATFDDSDALNSGGQPTDRASVNWGDGTTPSAGTVSFDGDSNQYVISGGHVYAVPGNYTITATFAGNTVSNIVPVVESSAGTSADWSSSNGVSGGGGDGAAIPTGVESGSVLVATLAAGGGASGGSSGSSGSGARVVPIRAVRAALINLMSTSTAQRLIGATAPRTQVKLATIKRRATWRFMGHTATDRREITR